MTPIGISVHLLYCIKVHTIPTNINLLINLFNTNLNNDVSINKSFVNNIYYDILCQNNE